MKPANQPHQSGLTSREKALEALLHALAPDEIATLTLEELAMLLDCAEEELPTTLDIGQDGHIRDFNEAHALS